YQLVSAEDARLVGTVDGARVFSVAHPGAVYLHQGRQYRVEHLDLELATATVRPVDVDEYTVPRTDVDIAVVAANDTKPVGAAHAHLGSVLVTTATSAYQRRALSSGEVTDLVDLDLPPVSLHTRACWYTVPPAVVGVAGIDPVRILGAVHAAEHAMIGTLGLFAICDRWDVGGVSMAAHPATGEPTIFVYDGYPGGAGIAELAFGAAEAHMRVTAEAIGRCGCTSGCPSCVTSPKCGNWNEYLDKDAALALLRAVLGS
ncbi:MAG: Zn-binding domain-containing protein, partial [Acidimicrobiia bacterium]